LAQVPNKTYSKDYLNGMKQRKNSAAISSKKSSEKLPKHIHS
jgi:hypothetical protein